MKKIGLTNRTKTYRKVSLWTGQNNTKTERQKHKAEKNEVRVDKKRDYRDLHGMIETIQRDFKKRTLTRRRLPNQFIQTFHPKMFS